MSPGERGGGAGTTKAACLSTGMWIGLSHDVAFLPLLICTSELSEHNTLGPTYYYCHTSSDIQPESPKFSIGVNMIRSCACRTYVRSARMPKGTLQVQAHYVKTRCAIMGAMSLQHRSNLSDMIECTCTNGTVMVKEDFRSVEIPFSDLKEASIKYWRKFLAHNNDARAR